MQGRLELWAEHAHDVLRETAQVYHLGITDTDLARIVQLRSEQTSDMPARSWLPKVLRIVAQRAADAGEPPLTSLVVRAVDGKVGPEYAEVMALTGQDGDRDEAAAQARLDCYRRFAHAVPDDATPNLHPITSLASDTRGTTRATSRGTTRTRAASRPAKVVVEEKAPAICMSCFLELPLSGICPNCS